MFEVLLNHSVGVLFGEHAAFTLWDLHSSHFLPLRSETGFSQSAAQLAAGRLSPAGLAGGLAAGTASARVGTWGQPVATPARRLAFRPGSGARRGRGAVTVLVGLPAWPSTRQSLEFSVTQFPHL